MNNHLQVVQYPFISDGLWGSTRTIVSNAYDVDVSLSLGDLNDTFNFNIPNTSLDINEWNIQDKVNIHLITYGGTVAESNLVFNGLVKNISEVASKEKILNIEGTSLGEILTTGLVFADDTNVNVMTYLQSCLNSIKNRNPNFLITWNASNPTTKRDGSAFPVINVGKISDFDRSFNMIIQKYLTSKYMDDGVYYWYVDTNNELVIRPQENISQGTLTEGIEIVNAKYSYDSRIYNFIIVKCGYDPANRPITSRAVDYASIAKHGMKYYMLIDNNIAETLLSQDGLTTGNPYPSTYPHTCSWKDESGNTVTASSDTDYRNKFRVQVKVIGAKYGSDFIELNSGLLMKFSIILMPTYGYLPGQVITINAPSYNLNNKNMRITDVQYSLVNTVLTLKEDIAI